MRGWALMVMAGLLAVVTACSGTTTEPAADRFPSSTTDSSRPGRGFSTTTSAGEAAPIPSDLVVDAAPPAELAGELPVFFFLFTHTEDPFNHELSEERYTRLIPVVGQIAEDHPDAHVSWTVMFQGADARTVAERNSATGVADLLRAAAAAGLIEFGYHAHHDPTYLNRPQTGFNAASTWEQLVRGMDEWVSCRKDLNRGGCIEPGAGGVLAVEDFMGDVAVASGLFTFGYEESGAGVHAMRRYDPERMIGFGYADHGPIVTSGTWSDALPDLLSALAPAWDTSPSLVWVDDIIRINGGNALEGVSGINTLKGAAEASEKMDDVDRNRVQFFNAGVASKYHYTVGGTSPTIYGYAHPDAPELPPDLILDRSVIERSYATTQETVEWLAGFAEREDGSRFVDSDWIIEHVAPTEYFDVSRDQIDRMAQWLGANWSAAPPAWVYDGLDYFSVRDAVVLLAMATTEPEREHFELLPAYGPFTDAGARPAAGVAVAALEGAASLIAGGVATASTSPWQVTPTNLLAPTYGAESLSLAQVLYGLSELHLASNRGESPAQVDVVATQAAPGTLATLQAMGCPTCFDTAWSLKPARIRIGE